MFIIGALAAALGFGVVLVAKLALALLVTLGPIFIACALFDATRRFFFGWLSQAVNYLVLFALIIVIFQLVLSLGRRLGLDRTLAEPVGELFTPGLEIRLAGVEPFPVPPEHAHR